MQAGRFAFVLLLAAAGACAPLLFNAETAPPPGDVSTQPPTRALPEAPTETQPPTPVPTLPATPAADLLSLDIQAAAMRPEFTDDVLALEEATRYWIDVEIAFPPGSERAVISGWVRVHYTNTTSEPLPDVVLMLWPNHEQYRSRMTAGPALVNGALIAPTFEFGDLAMRLDLPQALPAGGSLDLSLPFEVQIESFGGSIPRRLGITEGVLIAPSFYPLIPRRLASGWEVHAAPGEGDTTNSDTAFYTLQVRAPAELSLAVSGVETDRAEVSGVQSATFVTGPVRDVALALGPLEETTRSVAGVTLRGWVLPDHEGDTRTLMDAAALQLETLSELIGPYPYRELDVIDAPGAFGGIEYPGLVYVGTMEFGWIVIPTVHEVAHQWFYGLVGSDQRLEPWLDEALATYSEVIYYENSPNRSRATWTLADFRARVRDHPAAETPIGLPVEAYATGDDYASIVYLKGALFLQELRQAMGERTFFEFLKAYFAAHRYGFAGAEDFQALAESTCACELGQLFDLWVYEGGELPGP